MRHFRYLACLSALIASADRAAARDLDPNGPAIPVMRYVEGEGIEYTGEVISRDVYATDDKYLGYYVEINGYPKVMVMQNGVLYAIPTTATIEQIDKYYGGDGVVPDYDGTNAKLPEAKDKTISLEDIPARDNVIDLDEVAQSKGPIDIFTDEEIGAINPKDGTWASRMNDFSVTGCPPGVEGAAMSAMGLSKSVSVTFTKPWWHPSDMSDGFRQMSWRPVGANGYFSNPYLTGPEAAGSGMSLSVTMALNVTSEVEMDVWGRVQINLAPFLAKMIGGSESCTAIVRGIYYRQG